MRMRQEPNQAEQAGLNLHYDSHPCIKRKQRILLCSNGTSN